MNKGDTVTLRGDFVATILKINQAKKRVFVCYRRPVDGDLVKSWVSFAEVETW